MGPLDLLLILLALGVLGFLTYQKMARALFTLAVLWGATLIATLLYEEAVFRLQAVLGQKDTGKLEGIMFIVLFLIFFVVGYALTHAAFPVTHLPKLGILDYIMGFLLGAMVAVILVSLLFNATGVMVREPWENYAAWARAHSNFVSSPLRGLSRQALQVYRWLFVPFMRALPPILVPQ